MLYDPFASPLSPSSIATSPASTFLRSPRTSVSSVYATRSMDMSAAESSKASGDTGFCIGTPISANPHSLYLSVPLGSSETSASGGDVWVTVSWDALARTMVRSQEATRAFLSHLKQANATKKEVDSAIEQALASPIKVQQAFDDGPAFTRKLQDRDTELPLFPRRDSSMSSFDGSAYGAGNPSLPSSTPVSA